MRLVIKGISLVAALTVVLVILAFAPANATRPVPSKAGSIDRCANIEGRQPAYMLVGTGPYRRVPGTRDCYRVSNPHR